MAMQRTSVFLEERQMEALKTLSKLTRIRLADYIREGVDLVLQKYQKELKKKR